MPKQVPARSGRAETRCGRGILNLYPGTWFVQNGYNIPKRKGGFSKWETTIGKGIHNGLSDQISYWLLVSGYWPQAKSRKLTATTKWENPYFEI